MKRYALLMAILYLVFPVSGSLYGIGEKTVKLGGDSGWKMAERRNGITETALLRPFPVLMLASAPAAESGSGNLNLSLSFDEGNPVLFRDSVGNYRLTVSPALAAVDRRYSRAGYGAALFSGAPTAAAAIGGGGPIVIEAGGGEALFSGNRRLGDFSMEFWLYPSNLENGEQILLWTASGPETAYPFQRIHCVTLKNKLHWSFDNFFCSPDGGEGKRIVLSGLSPVVPKTWSHHLIRFDSSAGLVEYIVNGRAECIVYATSSGGEGGEVYTPAAGEGGSFVLGGGFSGLIDEFKIYDGFVSGSSMNKYPSSGGRMETAAIDLGGAASTVIKIDVSGGRTAAKGPLSGGEYKNGGRFLFSDDSEMQFFIRSSNNPYSWESPWIPVTPGTETGGNISGRYVQLAADFYPSAGGESAPYLEELRLTYFPDEPPMPPARLSAVALDGAVRLSWKSADQKAAGYLVYYGTSPDDYFGTGAARGPSPVAAGNVNDMVIDGLENGVLYYFRVAAYGSVPGGTAAPNLNLNAAALRAGEFSREVRARPLPGLAGL